MNARGTTNGFPATRLGRGVASLAHDATTIAELQAKLVALDLQEGSRFIRNGVILAVVGSALLLACLPVGMVGIAELLVALASWSRWVAYLVTGGAALLVSLVLLWLGWIAVRRSGTSFRRSRDEFTQNVQWFKQLLRGQANGSPSDAHFGGRK